MLCPICGTEPSESFPSHHASVAKCGAADCGHLYAESPAPGQGVQAHPAPEADYLAFAARNRRLLRFWLRRGFLGLDSIVLDVGSGSGHVARTIREQLPRTRIQCLESDLASRDRLRGWGFDVRDSFEALDRGFDAVVLIEVIEHFADPVGMLAACRRCAVPAAQLFITTPCGETTVGSRRTHAYDTPEHIHFFTEQSLRVACRKAGFAAVDYLSPTVMYPPGTGRARLLFALKALLRPLRDGMGGRHHLVAMVH